MAETKWTPGLWRIEDITAPEVNDGMPMFVIRATDPEDETVAAWEVCKTEPWCGCPDTSEANAHLIAAAPELYEALDILASAALPFNAAHRDTLNKALYVASLAMAKARGEY